MINKKLTFTTLLFALLCITFVLARPVQAQSAVSAGVSSGNEFTYKLQGIFSSASNMAVPASIQDLNKTESYKVLITAVSGADVTLDATWRFNNGTELKGAGHINVDTSFNDQVFWMVFATNLNIGDLVRPSGPGEIMVNGTVSRTYPDGQRDTNYFGYDFQYQNVNDSSRTYTQNTLTYFDKQTGMLVSLWEQSVYKNPDYTSTITYELVDSSVWAAPEFPVIVILPIFMATAGLMLIAIKKKRVNPTAHATPTIN